MAEFEAPCEETMSSPASKRLSTRKEEVECGCTNGEEFYPKPPRETACVNARKDNARRIEELEAKLKAAIVVGDWRLEQLKTMDEGKRAVEKTLEDERRLFHELSVEQAHEHTARIQALQDHWYHSLISNGGFDNARTSVGSSVGKDQSLAEKTLSVIKLEKSLLGMREQLRLRTEERDKWKEKAKNLGDLQGLQRQLQLRTLDLERAKAQVAKLEKSKSQMASLAEIESDKKKQEEVCQALLEQLEQQNQEIQNLKKNRQEIVKKVLELRHELRQREEDLHKLRTSRKTVVTECIICMDEFGEEPERQRTHWVDCNHANVCYKCTTTLWNSKKRKCPSCNTPASNMPKRLPPNIFL